MSQNHQLSGSFEQHGVTAEFFNGVSVTGGLNANDLQISGTFVGSSEFLDLGTADPGVGGLTFGSASEDGYVHGPWVKDGGMQTITLTASSSGIKFDHFTFLKDKDGEWLEESNYLDNQNGFKKVNTLEQPDLDIGVHRYLLIAVNSSSLITRIKYSTVVINP